ncbi:hypothetical protein JZ785_19835 [Alicyclobacillus curvatus]|nr:hypothetical protein JZ785_19835 [Alicyclobacillus curvatus]
MKSAGMPHSGVGWTWAAKSVADVGAGSTDGAMGCRRGTNGVQTVCLQG